MNNPPLILIVDDEPDTVALLKRVCQRAQYAVEVASDGLAAVELAQHLAPDLMLLDVQMPYLNGFEVVQHLRQTSTTAGIPIIVITANATKPEDVAHGIELGADDYIAKPFSYHELLARMRSKLRAKELEETLQQRTAELELLVKLGNYLTHLQGLHAQCDQLLRFLLNELHVSACLLQISPQEDHPGFAILADPQSTRYIPYPATTAINPAEILDRDTTQQLFANPQMESGIRVTLNQQNTPFGVLAIAHHEPNAFDMNVLRLMRSISQQAALAIINSILYESLLSYTTDLEKRVEERTKALQQAQAHLMRSEKLSSLGRLAGEIAHEINNPLQPIMTCLEGALEDLEDEQAVDPEDLKLAVSEVKRLKRTVTRLLDFARPDTSQMSSLDINQVIEEVLALTRKKMSLTQVKGTTHLQTISPIYGNSDQLKQVFLNIVINAIDAMSEMPNGSLDIETWEENQLIHTTIADTGKGIPQELLERIFEPFFSTKEYGSGLGLAISYSIIEAHGGKIHVESQANVGTRFKISLPIHVSPPS